MSSPERTPVPSDLAEWLQGALAESESAERVAASARANLVTLLTRARRDGYSLRALADAVGLSVGRVRTLLGHASPSSGQPL